MITPSLSLFLDEMIPIFVVFCENKAEVFSQTPPAPNQEQNKEESESKHLYLIFDVCLT